MAVVLFFVCFLHVYFDSLLLCAVAVTVLIVSHALTITPVGLADLKNKRPLGLLPTHLRLLPTHYWEGPVGRADQDQQLLT